jgi:type IV pilus assembly protein PilB
MTTKLLQELFAQGLLKEEQMEGFSKEALKSGRTEEDIILEKKIMSEQALFELKSKVLNMPLKKIKADEVPPEVLELIPEEAAENYKMMPLSKGNNFVQIGMVYPENVVAQNALRFLANKENFSYQVYLITFSDLFALLKQRKNLSLEAKKALDELNKEKGKILGTLKEESSLGPMTEDAPVIKMVLVILRHALEGSASDIHIEPQRDKLAVRFRINGVLHASLTLPLNVHAAIAARIKILAGLKIDENRIPQDGRFSTKINGLDIDFRVATFPTLYGEKVEMRVLDPSTGARSFEELGLEGRNLEIVKEAIKKPYGMILFTGPTGSGKTTTQYAILRILNKDGVNIVTVEDPIEYSIDGINQSQVKPEIGYTFASGMRQILRQDPNIIMIGEIRDEETADLVINAALTGHIVLSTLHTNSSVGVVARLLDMGIKQFLIPSTLRVVISQRLVRTLCQNCKIKKTPVDKVRNYLQGVVRGLPQSAKKNLKIPEPLYVYEPKGCEKCNFSGYAGRTGLFEVLSMNEELEKLIQTNPLESLLFKAAQKQGMLTMEQEGVLKVIRGQTSVEEIMRAAGAGAGS